MHAPGLQGTSSEFILCLFHLPLKTLYKLGYMENADLRLQPRPWRIQALCKVLHPPSGDMEVPNVPKEPRNLTININLELFLSCLDDIVIL